MILIILNYLLIQLVRKILKDKRSFFVFNVKKLTKRLYNLKILLKRVYKSKKKMIYYECFKEN